MGEKERNRVAELELLVWTTNELLKSLQQKIERHKAWARKQDKALCDRKDQARKDSEYADGLKQQVEKAEDKVLHVQKLLSEREKEIMSLRTSLYSSLSKNSLRIEGLIKLVNILNHKIQEMELFADGQVSKAAALQDTINKYKAENDKPSKSSLAKSSYEFPVETFCNEYRLETRWNECICEYQSSVYNSMNACINEAFALSASQAMKNHKEFRRLYNGAMPFENS